MENTLETLIPATPTLIPNPNRTFTISRCATMVLPQSTRGHSAIVPSWLICAEIDDVECCGCLNFWKWGIFTNARALKKCRDAIQVSFFHVNLKEVGFLETMSRFCGCHWKRTKKAQTQEFWGRQFHFPSFVWASCGDNAPFTQALLQAISSKTLRNVSHQSSID